MKKLESVIRPLKTAKTGKFGLVPATPCALRVSTAS